MEGIKQMLPAPRAAAVARQMSVAGDPDWVTALAARAFVYGELRTQPAIAGRLLINQSRLGFVAARSALMQRADGQRGDHWAFEAREWDVPVWFWESFTSEDSSSQAWELGTFAGRGIAPTGRCTITLTGVYFARSSLAAMLPELAKSTAPALAAATGGRLPAAFWDDLWCAVWGEVHRGDLKPKLLADVERAMMQWITDNDHRAAESVVRERARKMLAEYQREDGNLPRR
jgi:hypothetical protein